MTPSILKLNLARANLKYLKNGWSFFIIFERFLLNQMNQLFKKSQSLTLRTQEQPFANAYQNRCVKNFAKFTGKHLS